MNNIVSINKAIKDSLLSKTTALGNSGRKLKNVASDLVNDYYSNGGKDRAILDGTFLSKATIERMRLLTDSESGLEYQPNADTIERILVFFGAEIYFKGVKIKSANANKEKLPR